MIKVKTPLSPLELSIVSGIDDVQANHIKFHNISFCCDSIEDCERRVFIQRKKGKWIDDKCSACGYKCSSCGYRVELEERYCENCQEWYCDNCWAELRGKQE